jgi:lysophospholipase L1-like esterase
MFEEKLLMKKPLNIVCLGDSITYGYLTSKKRGEQVDNHYPLVLKQMLREIYDYQQINVFNSGVPGWQVRQALKNLDAKVYAHKPDMCIIMYGINDARGSFNGGFRRTKKQFYEKYNELINELKAHNIEVVIMTPNYAEVKRLDEFCEIIKLIASEQNVKVVDNYQLFEEIVSVNDTKNILPDKIHLRSDLYEVIAYNFVKTTLSRN